MKTRFKSNFYILTLILNIKSSNQNFLNQARNKLKYLETTQQIKREIIPSYEDEKIVINEKSYDFIIIGGGTSGSIIADKLSNPATGWSVLVLEAGSNPDSITEVPFWSNLHHFDEENVWKLNAERENTFGRGLKMGKTKIITGKGLGGTSILSHGLFSVGRKTDFDSWRIPEWNSKEIFEKIKKLKDEIFVEEVNFKSEVAKKFVETAINEDYLFKNNYLNENDEDMKQICYVKGFLKNGLKQTGEKHFRSSHNRKSLTIYKNSFVTKIIFEPKPSKKNKAIGVKFLHNNKINTVYAKKEIILAAGALNTPKFLMLSGIGPEKHLKSLQIPVLNNLPVGETLFDHPSFWGLLFVTKEGFKSNEIVNENSIKQLYLNKTGILGILGNGVEAILTENSTEMLLLRNHFSSQDQILKSYLGISDKTYEKYENLKKRRVYTVLITLLKPESTGKIELISKNPNDPPKINLKYFSNENDLNLMIEGIRKGRKILLMEPIKQFGKPYDVPFPGCYKHIFDSDGYWKCFIEHLSTGSHDYSSTCSIGKVVDEKLKVIGVEKLRIGDLSVIPKPISGHNQALGYVIGAKLSDFIKNDYLRDEL